MSSTKPLRILVIAQGCGGGIGRFELLFEEALTRLERTGLVLWQAAHKASYPAYLVSRSGPETGRRTSLAARALAAAVRFRPDVVVFTHLNLCPLVAPMRALRRHARFVAIVHGTEAWVRIPLLRRTALVSCDSIWSVSDYTATELAAVNAIPKQRISLIRVGLGATQLAALEARDRGPRSSQVLVTVSRLEGGPNRKGVDLIIKALSRVVLEFPDSRLVVVGDGSGRRQLERQTRELGLTEHVSFTGWLDDASLARAYHDSDVFVLPSAQEGFGLVYLEAMAASLPIVAARSGAVPEVVRDGDTGLLIDYGDTEGLAIAISRLLGDERMRKAMGRRGIETVREAFTIHEVTDGLVRLLSELIPAKFALLNSR